MATKTAKKPAAKKDLTGQLLKTGMITLGVGTVAAGIYALVKKAQNPNAPLLPESISNTVAKAVSTVKTPTVAWVDGTFPLKEGQYNSRKVLYLQQALIRLGVLANGGADGDFGPKTAAALRAASVDPAKGINYNTYNGFLMKAGMTQLVNADGSFKTAVATSTAVPAATATVSTVSSSQLEADARFINSELTAINTNEEAILHLFVGRDDAYLRSIIDTYNRVFSYNYDTSRIKAPYRSLLIYMLKNQNIGTEFAVLISNLERVQKARGISGLGSVAGQLDSNNTLLY